MIVRHLIHRRISVQVAGVVVVVVVAENQEKVVSHVGMIDVDVMVDIGMGMEQTNAEEDVIHVGTHHVDAETHVINVDVIHVHAGEENQNVLK